MGRGKNMQHTEEEPFNKPTSMKFPLQKGNVMINFKLPITEISP